MLSGDGEKALVRSEVANGSEKLRDRLGRRQAVARFFALVFGWWGSMLLNPAVSGAADSKAVAEAKSGFGSGIAVSGSSFMQSIVQDRSLKSTPVHQW